MGTVAEIHAANPFLIRFSCSALSRLGTGKFVRHDGVAMTRKPLPPELTALLERAEMPTDVAGRLRQFGVKKDAEQLAARLKDPPRRVLLYASILSLVFWIALGVLVAALLDVFH